MRLTLRPMAEEEREGFVRRQRVSYAADLVRTHGLEQEEAERKAEADYGIIRRSVPAGHYLFVIEDAGSGDRVGDLWFGPSPGRRPGTAFLYDIVIDEALRGRGLGRQAMRLFEERAGSLGFVRMGLHVFADNEPARSLYRSLGYVEQSVWMGKDVDRESEHESFD
jgi:ribosomal protein S18 acetylase RimI-like enzyme